MISRRHIRIKVMQTLYTLVTAGEIHSDTAVRKGLQILDQQLSQTLDHFTTAVLLPIRVAQYSETDSNRRRSKHLPSPEDLSVPTKIAGNTSIWTVLDNEGFQKRIKASGLEKHVTDDFLRKIYKSLQSSEVYEAYNAKEERSPKEEKAMFQYIWDNLIAGTEWGQDYLAEEMSGWEDDREIMTMMMENFFRKPSKGSFSQLLTEEKLQYAQDLLKYCIQKEEYLNELITPRLQNWDPERVAQIDFILLRMGICELLYFPTIPTKVTINEYIDIAKTYSTGQSGQFINGVLDNILKSLTSEGLIRKQDRIKKV